MRARRLGVPKAAQREPWLRFQARAPFAMDSLDLAEGPLLEAHQRGAPPPTRPPPPRDRVATLADGRAILGHFYLYLWDPALAVERYLGPTFMSGEGWLAVTGDDRYLARSDYDLGPEGHTALVEALATWDEVWRLDLPERIDHVAIAPDARLAACASTSRRWPSDPAHEFRDFEFEVRRPPTWRPRHERPFVSLFELGPRDAHERARYALRALDVRWLEPAHLLVATSTAVLVIDVASERVVEHYPCAGDHWALSADARILATMTADGAVLVWRRPTGRSEAWQAAPWQAPPLPATAAVVRRVEPPPPPPPPPPDTRVPLAAIAQAGVTWPPADLDDDTASCVLLDEHGALQLEASLDRARAHAAFARREYEGALAQSRGFCSYEDLDWLQDARIDRGARAAAAARLVAALERVALVFSPGGPARRA